MLLPSILTFLVKRTKFRFSSSKVHIKKIFFTMSSSDSMDEKSIPNGYQLIQEGSAKMLFPSTGAVFYNPVQVQNRDLSVLMISLFAERHVKRQILKQKKKEFASDRHADHNQQSALQTQIKEFEQTADWAALFQRHKDVFGITVLDALAASGLRSIRYWKEIPGIHSVTINDLDPAAIDLAKENISFNNLTHVLIPKINSNPVESTIDDSVRSKPGIRLQLGDATHEMYMSRRLPNLKQEHWTVTQFQQKNQYHVIDLDPYGSAAMFLDAAIQAVVDHGLLAITCTDMAALGGSHPETCYGRYASMPIPRAKYLQELALRILLRTIASTAAKYGRSIKPILSVGMNFYVRVFVEIWDDKAAVNDLSLNIGTVYQSTQCPSFHIVPNGQKSINRNVWQPSRAPQYPTCQETGAPFKTAGPIWLGPLHDQSVVLEAIHRLEKNNGTSILATRRNLLGLLSVVSEELPDVPLYYSLSGICKSISCTAPPIDSIRAALINAGYRVSSYHKDPEAIKTDAPNHVLWDIFRCWSQQTKSTGDESPKETNTTKKQKTESLEKSSLGKDIRVEVDDEKDYRDAREKILSVKPELKADFTLPDILKQTKKKISRFPMNPEPHWGPKPKASGYNCKPHSKR